MKPLLPVYLAVVLDLVGFGIVIPLLTFYAEEYGAGPVEVTLLMAVYSLAQFIMAPVWGSLSDRFGRRPIMLFSIGMATICLAGFAWAESLFLLFFFRVLHGAAAANISTAQACVADITTPENRAMGMGMIGAAFGFGFTVGPFLGGELSVYGMAAPIWVAAALSLVNWIIAVAWLKETRNPDTVRHVRSIHPRVFLEMARHPVVGMCITLTFVMTIAFAIMESSFTLFAEHVHDLDARAVGRMFGVAGITMIIVQGGLIRHLVKRFGEGPLVPMGISILSIGLLALPHADPPWAMVGVFMVIAVGQGIASPSLNSLISQGAAPSEQGFVLGTNQSMSALARVLGPTAAGWLYLGGPAWPFYVSGAILGASVFLASRAVKQSQPIALSPEE
jgi:DHA1 family tetracycline resistance protein-like MFS transporter